MPESLHLPVPAPHILPEVQAVQEIHSVGTRILGLDALRFLCALCVVQGHLRLGGTLVLDRLREPHDLVRMIRIAFNQGFPIPTGPNAVIVFFVISGFCIHFPYRNATHINFQQFIVRRYLRIGIPAVVAAFLLYNTGFHSLQDSVLWSILCEAIYYSLYPFLLVLKHRVGWQVVLGGSFLLAYSLIVLRMGGRYNGNFTSFGAGLTWILGLPCWILGCVLAETYARFKAHRWWQQWCFRLGIVIAAAIGTTLRFYAGIGYYWSEPALALLIYCWLGTEIAYFRVRKPWRWLEWCGRWSYSVYLYHAPVAILTAGYAMSHFGMPNTLLLEVGAVLVGCYLLHCVVERPAHLLARRYTAPDRAMRLIASRAPGKAA